MGALTRRSFLAGAAAVAVAPVSAAAAVQPDFDVMIVGAGAAGIAAARRIAATGRRMWFSKQATAVLVIGGLSRDPVNRLVNKALKGEMIDVALEPEQGKK